MEYAAEASYAPLVASCVGAVEIHQLRTRSRAAVRSRGRSPRDANLAEDPACADTLEFRVMAAARWDLAAFDAEVRDSQARRWVVYDALRNGAYFPWDFQPLRAASERYMRNHMDLNVLEESQRFPAGRMTMDVQPPPAIS
jgi:choline-sulfatase